MGQGRVLVVGEALLDVVHRDGTTTSLPGGSAANVAVALGRVGRDVGLATCLGRDAGGRHLAEHLQAAEVDLVGDPWVLDRTSVAEATPAADGSASYRFDLCWTPGRVELDPGTAALHVGSIGALLAPGADVVLDVVRRARGQVLVSYDVNARASITGTGPEVVARVEEFVGLADVVKVSDEDLTTLWPGLDEGTAVVHLLDLGAGAVALTRGSAGATWVEAARRVDVAAPEVAVADTIGAGDTFAGVLLDGLVDVARPWPTEDLEAALDRAVLAAGITVSRPGADPPWAEELAAVAQRRRRTTRDRAAPQRALPLT